MNKKPTKTKKERKSKNKSLRMCAICEKIVMMGKFTRFCGKVCRTKATLIEGGNNEYKFSIPGKRS
jgi:hypothetical protein